LRSLSRQPTTRQHLKERHETCRAHNLKLSSSDRIRMVCPECGIEEVCPSVLCEQDESKHPEGEQDGS
jgi:predicted RNA-binding Zn-ribbon protein involved in translation (DUF1610 family)